MSLTHLALCGPVSQGAHGEGKVGGNSALAVHLILVQPGVRSLLSFFLPKARGKWCRFSTTCRKHTFTQSSQSETQPKWARSNLNMNKHKYSSQEKNVTVCGDGC